LSASWIPTVLATGAAVVLSACASAPSGHYRFALAAGEANAAKVWSLSSLPRHGRIVLAAHTGKEVNPRQSTHLLLELASPARSFTGVALNMNDPGCQGAYSFSLEHSTQPDVTEIEYFDRKLPWAAPLEVRLEWWPDGRFEIEIANVGRRALDWRDPATAFDIRLLAGSLQVDELDYENLSSR
jgi:hypothetical protein